MLDLVRSFAVPPATATSADAEMALAESSGNSQASAGAERKPNNPATAADSVGTTDASPHAVAVDVGGNLLPPEITAALQAHLEAIGKKYDFYTTMQDIKRLRKSKPTEPSAEVLTTAERSGTGQAEPQQEAK